MAQEDPRPLGDRDTREMPNLPSFQLFILFPMIREVSELCCWDEARSRCAQHREPEAVDSAAMLETNNAAHLLTQRASSEPGSLRELTRWFGLPSTWWDVWGSWPSCGAGSWSIMSGGEDGAGPAGSASPGHKKAWLWGPRLGPIRVDAMMHPAASKSALQDQYR